MVITSFHLGVLFFFFEVLGFELRAYTSSHSTSAFIVMGFFATGPHNYLPGLTSNHDLLISAS
jgi:hypothetical protein